jgi:CDGSH iron-sulfur domain-containing protein 3
MTQPLPRVCDTRPQVMDMEPGNYAFCTCGLSANQPFCDGKHIGHGMVPQLVQLTEAKKVAWCMCKHSQKGHQCDGSHRNLTPPQA